MTLIGLIALLVIPVAAWRTDKAQHERSETILEPARDHIDRAIRKAQDMRAFAFTYYEATDRDAAAHHADPRQRYEAMYQAFLAETDAANEARIRQCGPVALRNWLAGRRQLGDWLNLRGRHWVSDGVPYNDETIEQSNDLFESGVAKLDLANSAVILEQDETRDQIAATVHIESHLLVRMALISLAVACVSLFNLYNIRRGSEREHEIAKRLETAVKETNHRIKNNLQVIAALIDMQVEDSDETVPKSVLTEIMQQVRAVAAVHDFLSHELRSDKVQADQMLSRLVELVKMTSTLEVMVDSEEVVLPVRQATALSLIVNELLANAGKHGASEAHVAISAKDNACRLEVKDNGPGFPEDFDPVKSANLGLTLISSLTQTDLAGTVAFDGNPGARVTVTFPLSHNSHIA